jgi:hypothetical protein
VAKTDAAQNVRGERVKPLHIMLVFVGIIDGNNNNNKTIFKLLSLKDL